MYYRTSYDPLIDGPPRDPRHVDDSLAPGEASPVTQRRWARGPLLGGTRRRLGSALVELGRFISPELRHSTRT